MDSLDPWDLDPERLLVQALHGRFKEAGAAFAARPPDDVTATRLVEAWRAGSAPAWLTAYLLGCLRGPSGYGVVLAILEAEHGQLAESYAGPALVKIAGAQAVPDLIRVMHQGESQRSREGALFGLRELRDPDLIPRILEGVVALRVRARVAGAAIARMGATDETLVAWLGSTEDVLRDVAIEAAADVLLAPGAPPNPILARAVVRALDAGRVKLSPRVRQRLGERVDPAFRPP